MADATKVVSKLNKRVKYLNRVLTTRRIVGRLILALGAILAVMWGGLSISRTYAGSFKVNLTTQNKSISLSETIDFDDPKTTLFVPLPKRFTHFSYTELPFKELGTKDGSNNGLDYLSYTFYLKNTGNVPLTYTRVLRIVNSEKDLQEAIRVMVIYNDETTIYADPIKDTENSPEKVYYFDEHALFNEDLTSVPFSNEATVFDNTSRSIEGDQVDKYTILVWIEGSDPECDNSKITGMVKMVLDFTVIE